MRTNIDIDEELIRQAMDLTNLSTKKATVTLALEELVAKRRRMDLRDLFGHVTFDPDYDYKALRQELGS